MNMRPFFPAPRFMTDEQLREHFGLSDRALTRLRMTETFPRRDELTNKTDRKAVDLFFDQRSGILFSRFSGNGAGEIDGEECFHD